MCKNVFPVQRYDRQWPDFQPRLLQPGVAYMVYPLQPSVYLGGNFYSRSTFSDTLRALVWCKYRAGLAKKEGGSSLLVLLKLLARYTHQLSEQDYQIQGASAFILDCFVFITEVHFPVSLSA